MRTNEATVNKITKILKMNIFLLFSLLFCLSVAKEELPFSLEQLLEDNPALIKLIEKRLGSEKQSKGDENPLDESDVEDEKQEKYATAGSFSDTEGSLSNEKYPTILNTKNRDGGKCVPTVRMSSIIRSNASLKNGAKFLAKLEKRSDAECRERCCNISRCNLAVFENKEGNNCYLFDCGNPSQCRFAQNDDYIAYEYSYKSNEQSHENELDILEKPPPEQKTPVPVLQTKAPTTQKPQAIALYGSCYWGDVCADVNAICIRSQCRCKQGFYDKDGICIYTTCSRGMFECKIKESPMCLQNSKLCNGVQDCDDGMDERNCPTAGSAQAETVLSENQHTKISGNDIHRTGQVVPEQLKLEQKAPVNTHINVGSQNRPSAIKDRPVHPNGHTSLYGNKFRDQSNIGYNSDQGLHKAGQPSFNQYWSGPKQLGGTGTGYYNQQNYGNGRTGSGLYDTSGIPQQDQWGYIDYKAYPGGYNRIPVPSNSNPQRQGINSLYNTGGRMLNPSHGISDIDYNQDTGSLNQNLDIMGNGRGIDINYNRNNPVLITSGHTPSPPVVKTTITTTTTPKPTTTTTTTTTQSTTTTTTTTTTPKPTTQAKTRQKQPSIPHSESEDGFFPSWGNHIVDKEQQNLDSYRQNDRKHTKQPYKHTKVNKVQNGYNTDNNDYMSGHKTDRNRHRNGGQRKYPTHRNNAGPRKQYQYGGSYGNGYPYKYNDYNGYQGNYPAWSDYDGDYLYRDVDYNDPRIPANKAAPKYDYDYQQRGPPARHDNKKPLPHLGKPVHLPTDVHPKPDEPVINKVPQTAAPHVIKSTPAPVTPGIVETKTEKPPQTPKPVKVDTSKIKNTTTDSDTKKQETKVSTNNKENTKKTNSTNKVKAEEVPDKGDNSIAEASNGKVIVASMTNDAQGPIVALSLGLAITLMLLIFVGCRLRTVKKRIRRGKALHSNEADYLINGMYL